MSHDHDHSAELPFPEKVQKLLDHWRGHNQDHAENYEKWKNQCQEHGLDGVSTNLQEAIDLTLQIDQKLAAAIKSLTANK